MHIQRNIQTSVLLFAIMSMTMGSLYPAVASASPGYTLTGGPIDQNLLAPLSETDLQKVDEWLDIPLYAIGSLCDSVSPDQINFVYIPLGYTWTGDPDTINDFKIKAEWSMWSIDQHEPFASYTNQRTAWFYWPAVEAEEFLSLEGMAPEEKVAQAKANQEGIETQAINARAELVASCPKLATSEYSADLVYIYIVNDTKMVDSTDGSFVDTYFETFGAYAFTYNGEIYLGNKGLESLLSPTFHWNVFEAYMTPTHELGHAYAGFWDEYNPYPNLWPCETATCIGFYGYPVSFAYKITPYNHGIGRPPSCLTKKYAQYAWGNMVGMDSDSPNLMIGYYAGCGGYSNLYRSSKKSIMTALDSDFDAVQTKYLCKALQKNTGKKLGVCGTQE